MTTAFVTGANGFAGSHLIPYLLDNTDWQIRALDRPRRLCDGIYSDWTDHIGPVVKAHPGRVRLLHHDFTQPYPEQLLRECAADYVIHAGAATEVERSFREPQAYLDANAGGTLHTVLAARQMGAKKFLYISTHEVYGNTDHAVDERTPLRPSNPYAASKASGEAIAQAFGIPTIIVRPTNLYGAGMGQQKFMAVAVRQIGNGLPLGIYTTADRKPYDRQWLYIGNCVSAVAFLLRDSKGGVFNLCGQRCDVLSLAHRMAGKLGHTLRHTIVPRDGALPPLDERYTLDDSAIRSCGWQPPYEDDDALTRTVASLVSQPVLSVREVASKA